jgi:hypothetical protein
MRCSGHPQATAPDFVKAAEAFVDEWLPGDEEIVAPLAEEMNDAYNAGCRRSAGGRATEKPVCDVCGQEEDAEVGRQVDVCQHCYSVARHPHPAVSEVVPAEQILALRKVAEAARGAISVPGSEECVRAHRMMQLALAVGTLDAVLEKKCNAPAPCTDYPCAKENK